MPRTDTAKKEVRKMKKIIVLFLLCLSTVGFSQEASPTPSSDQTPSTVASPPPPEHPAHEELRLLRQHMEDAMNARDIGSLQEGVAGKVVFSTMNGDVVVGKDGLKKYFDDMLGGAEPRVKDAKTHFVVDDLSVLYPGSNDPNDVRFAVAYGHSEDEYTLADNSVIKVQPRWSAAMVRDDRSWKIANFHYSVDMFDNPVVDKLRTLLWVSALGGLIVGLIIGFLLGRRKS